MYRTVPTPSDPLTAPVSMDTLSHWMEPTAHVRIECINLYVGLYWSEYE